jgi:hypothetical protein
MSKKINNKYYFGAVPLIAGMLFLTLIGLSYVGLVINPHALENFESTKEELRLPQEAQNSILAFKKAKAAIVGFANFLPDPLNRISFATIPIMSFLWLYFIFRKFGKDGIALEIMDDALDFATYKGRTLLKRSDILEISIESPSEIEFKTRLGPQYLSTTTVKDTNAKQLKAILDAWMSSDYELIDKSDMIELKLIDVLPDIHPT